MRLSIARLAAAVLATGAAGLGLVAQATAPAEAAGCSGPTGVTVVVDHGPLGGGVDQVCNRRRWQLRGLAVHGVGLLADLRPAPARLRLPNRRPARLRPVRRHPTLGRLLGAVVVRREVGLVGLRLGGRRLADRPRRWVRRLRVADRLQDRAGRRPHAHVQPARRLRSPPRRRASRRPPGGGNGGHGNGGHGGGGHSATPAVTPSTKPPTTAPPTPSATASATSSAATSSATTSSAPTPSATPSGSVASTTATAIADPAASSPVRGRPDAAVRPRVVGRRGCGRRRQSRRRAADTLPGWVVRRAAPAGGRRQSGAYCCGGGTGLAHRFVELSAPRTRVRYLLESGTRAHLPHGASGGTW